MAAEILIDGRCAVCHRANHQPISCEEAERVEHKAVQQLLRRAKQKGVYIGAPECYKLEMACQHVAEAFGGYGCYVVGSALERPDWRDVDVRLILSDDEFRTVFPTAHIHTGSWEFDSRWLLLNVAISGWLSAQTGLPIDFQIQPQTHANERHKGPRNAVGLKMAPRDGSTPSGEVKP